MATFLDDRTPPIEWVVRFDHSLLLRIRKALGVDLHHMTEQAKALERIVNGDAELLVNILYLACEEQCKARGISDEDFGRGFAEGETFQRSCLAIQEAIVSFTNPQRRPILKTTMQRTLGENQKAVALMEKVVTEAIREAETVVTAGA